MPHTKMYLGSVFRGLIWCRICRRRRKLAFVESRLGSSLCLHNVLFVVAALQICASQSGMMDSPAGLHSSNGRVVAVDLKIIFSDKSGWCVMPRVEAQCLLVKLEVPECCLLGHQHRGVKVLF